jgi:hypothetical protein
MWISRLFVGLRRTTELSGQSLEALLMAMNLRFVCKSQNIPRWLLI